MKPSTVVEPASLCISVFITEGSVARIRALSRASNTIRFSTLQEHRACCFADRTFYLSWPIARPLVLVLIFFFYDYEHSPITRIQSNILQKFYYVKRILKPIVQRQTSERFFLLQRYIGFMSELGMDFETSATLRTRCRRRYFAELGIIFELFRTNICLRQLSE